jgi:dienelactone hydrolase
MTRRTALALGVTAIAVRTEVNYRVYSQTLPDYLKRLAEESRLVRDTALGRLTDVEAVRRRQSWVRDTFWELIGGKPAVSSLDIRTVGGFEREHYRVEKLIYQSQPGLYIPANLYIPKDNQPPFPGVLFQMGHSVNGKAFETYQKCCQGLVRLGYLVLAFDPMGQGERTYYPQPNNGVLTRLDSADDEHTRPGKQMLLVGDSATRMHAWDAVRSLDVLASHPLVDPARLASTGQSGGGTVTMFLMAVDDRLASAAVSCANTENVAIEAFNPPGSVDDAEQNFINAGPKGFDRWDLFYPMAPKPMLICVSAHDSFGTYSPTYVANGRAEYSRLKRVYETFGREHSSNLTWYETPLPHSLSHDLRLRIYNFFESTLRRSRKPVVEPPVQPEPDEQLYVGSSGNVVRDFGSQTPLELAREKAKAFPRAAKASPLSGIAADSPRTTIELTRLGRAEGEVGPIEAVEVQVTPEVRLPGYIFLPNTRVESVIVPIEPRGRRAHWKEGDLYPKLASAGHAVAAFDIRGIGDLWPEVGRGNAFYTRPRAEEDSYAWASFMLGKPLLGQRVSDILAIVQALRNDPLTAKARIVLAGLGSLTVPVTFAATMDAAIQRVYLAKGLESYASLLTSEDYSEPFANFIPGVVAMQDLPELRQALGPRLRVGTAWDVATLSSF